MRILSLSLLTALLNSAFAQTPIPPNNVNGKVIYQTNCARCHGADATGGESGPNIVSRIAALSDKDLATFIREGRPSKGMPAINDTDDKRGLFQ